MKANKVYLGLGTNKGDREKNLNNALKYLKKILKITKTSSIYETAPILFKKQSWFLNMVIEGETKLSPDKLLKSLKEIEEKMGRKKTFRNGPRIIDLDILFYNAEIINLPKLEIPHPELQKRKFVLVPLNEIAPQFLHPHLQKDIKSLLNVLDSSDQVNLWMKKKSKN